VAKHRKLLWGLMTFWKWQFFTVALRSDLIFMSPLPAVWYFQRRIRLRFVDNATETGYVGACSELATVWETKGFGTCAVKACCIKDKLSASIVFYMKVWKVKISKTDRHKAGEAQVWWLSQCCSVQQVILPSCFCTICHSVWMWKEPSLHCHILIYTL